MTDLADKIERLSAAATPGKVMIVRYGDGDSLVLHVVNRETRICFMATPANDGDMRRIKANAKLLLELWNERDRFVSALRAAQHAEALAGVVEWYADTFCEHGKYSEVCGRLDDGQCSGCKARAALAAYRSVKP